MNKYDNLKIENQLCFPLYAASRQIIRQYHPFLDQLDLTYTQYIVLIVLWEKKSLCVKELGSKLFLDSGTLTPVLKSLEIKGYITRCRSTEDERVLNVCVTESGEKLKDKAVQIPGLVGACVKLEKEEAAMLQQLLQKLLEGFAQ